MTTKSLADKSDVPEDTIKNIRYGRVKDVKLSTAVKLALALECSLDQLTGITFVSEQEQRLLEKYRHLADTSKHFIGSLIEFESSLAEFEADAFPIRDEIIVFKPCGNMADGMIYDSSMYFSMDVRPYVKRFGAGKIGCGIYITNNSLAPIYLESDVLLVCHEAPRSGDTVIIVHKASGRLYIRKFFPGKVWVLEPLNHFGSTIYIDSTNPEQIEKWEVFGYVLTKTRSDITIISVSEALSS